jgi:hypothetical protein
VRAILLSNVRLRRSLFVGANVASALALFFFIWLPLQNFFDQRDADIAIQREALARWKAIAARGDDVKALTSRVGTELNRGELVAAANEGIANAELQSRLKVMAEASGAKLRSVQSNSPRLTPQLKYIGARIDIYGTIRAVQQAVYDIENSTPYIFVTGATLKLTALAGSPNAGLEPAIDAQLEILTPMQLGER